MMRKVRAAIVVAIVIAWVAAAGSLISGIVDPSSLPAFARSALSLWPDPDTPAALVVRFGSIAVVVAGIVTLRVLGKMRERRERDETATAHAGRQ